jgi:hypothetical protein
MDKAILGRGKLMRELSSEEFEALAAEVRSYNQQHRSVYNPQDFRGVYYYERCFLSCLLTGAVIPTGITTETFLIPRHKVIFEAIRELSATGIRGNVRALITWLDKIGFLKKAGGEGYLWEVESVIGIPSAVTAFAVELRRLALVRLQS